MLKIKLTRLLIIQLFSSLLQRPSVIKFMILKHYNFSSLNHLSELLMKNKE